MTISLARFKALYPDLALFEQEKGWRCGKSFISARSKCYKNPRTGKGLGFKYFVNPKTGRRKKVRVGLTYKEYQKARTSAVKKKGQGKKLTSLDKKYLADVERLTTSTRKKKERRLEARRKRQQARSTVKAETLKEKFPSFKYLQRYSLKDKEVKKGDLVIDGSTTGSNYYNQSVVGVSRDGKRYKLRPRVGLSDEQRKIMKEKPDRYDNWVGKEWLYKPGAKPWLREFENESYKQATGLDKTRSGNVQVSIDYEAYKTKSDPQLIPSKQTDRRGSKKAIYELTRKEYVDSFPGTKAKLRETYGDLDIDRISKDYVISWADRKKGIKKGTGKNLKEAAYSFAVNNRLAPDHYQEVQKALEEGGEISDRVLKNYFPNREDREILRASYKQKKR